MVNTTIDTSKAAGIYQNLPDTNFGTSFALWTGVDSTSSSARRTLMEFDISNVLDVPIDYISSATLNMDLYSVTGTARTIDFRLIDNNSWTEGGLTWNNQPTSSDYNIEDTWSSTGWKSVSIISILRDALRNGNTELGILLKCTDESVSTSDINFYRSDEYGGGSNAPYLSIEYDTYSQTRLKGSLCKNLLDKDGWGEITMTDHNCPSPCDAATFTFKTAWGTTYNTVLLDVGDTQQYNSGAMHHSFKLYSMAAVSVPCDNLAAATIEEKYWEDDCYVKTTGDNDRNGQSWAEAWSTVHQGANEAFDGQEVHLGFGTYNAEPANNDITPVNFGTVGIKYTPETAGTGGGTGSATVERN